jgi:hypothetical protein
MRITQSLRSWKSFHRKIIQRPLRFRAGVFLPSAAAMLTLLLSTASSSFAGSATWLTTPATGDWNTAANWTAGGPPDGSADTAPFASSNVTGVSLSAGILVDGIVFNAGASALTITASRGNFLQFWNVGITNNSGIAQTFVAAGDAFGSGIIFFSNGATAGNGTFINEGGTVAGAFAGSTIFENTSTAGNGTFTNNAGAASGGLGGLHGIRRHLHRWQRHLDRQRRLGW